jgi:hypothetical protein
MNIALRGGLVENRSLADITYIEARAFSLRYNAGKY